MRALNASHLLYAPPGFAVLSAAYLFAKSTRPFWFSRDATPSQLFDNDGETSRKPKSLKDTVEEHDGSLILLSRILRLLSVFALLGLEIFHSVTSGPENASGSYQVLSYVYAAFLGITSIVASTRWRDIASKHLTILLLLEFGAYFILDVCPYADLHPRPFDPASDPVTWIRVTLLALTGVIFPLFTPRPFRPQTPDAKPSIEETSSPFSRVTFGYLTSLVFLAWRVPSVGIDDIPEVPNRRTVEALSGRAMKNLDPLLAGRKKHVFWGFLKTWGPDYAKVFTWITLHSFAKFIGVLGTKYLLAYLESGVAPFGLHPWVWILPVGFGPSLSSYLQDQYLYVGTRINVENSSFVSYLVFHHALRIRLRSTALDDDEKEKKDAKSKATTSAEATDSATLAEAESESEEAEAEVDAETQTGGEDASEDTSAPEGGHAKEKTQHLVGKINNLITSDLRVLENSYTAVQIPSIVIQIIVSVALLYQLLGWSALVGFAMMAVLTPVPARIGQLIVGTQRAKMAKTDARVQSVTENLNVLRMIKLFAWEPYVLKELRERRVEELKMIRKGEILDLAMNMINTQLPLVAKMTTLAIYVLVIKGDLTPSRIFSAIMIFRILIEQMFMLTWTLPQALRSRVSYDRYNEFLNKTELLSDAKEQEGAMSAEAPDKTVIGFNNCSFSWNPLTGSEAIRTNRRTREEFRLQFPKEVLFKRDTLNIIVGPTASGKTSILMALLGEMYYKPQAIDSWYNLPRDRGVAYVPQESWVLNETIKDNILFGEPYDEERYKMVLSHCALERDLALWEAGDLTEVGEKGLTLSGGQKARVTLARAMYSSAPILLLDDVLASLDVHTAKWVVDNAFKGELLKGRTTLLVTHNVALVASVAGHVLLLGRHGEVTATGSVAEVLKHDPKLRAQVERKREEIEEDEAKEEQGSSDKKRDEEVKQATGKLIVAEEKAMGRVELAALMLYTKAVGGALTWLTIIGSIVFAIIVTFSESWFIGIWSTQYELHPPSEIPVLRYLLIYFGLCYLTEIIDFASLMLWLLKSLRASRIIYFQLVESVFSSTFRWLDVTPMGRMIARCTQDISSVDGPIAQMSYHFIRMTVIMLISFSLSVTMAGWSAFIPGLLLLVLGSFLGLVYLKCQICIRREMSNAQAPVISQISAALSGLPTIRAYGAQELFAKELRKRINLLTRTSLTFYDINRWISMRINTLSGIFSSAVAAYIIYGGRMGAGSAGFTLSVLSSFSRNVLFWVRMYNLLEVQANSLERILSFLRIDHEPKPSEDGKPPAYWPSSGSLRVENLSARYSEDSPEVLKDISFEISHGERVGVVGRTGAGKSSVALALLRAIKTSGSVYYDGLATDRINLDALRSNITLIPQQPELLHGTLRSNLDPFNQHDDAMLYAALRSAGLFDVHDATTEATASKAPINVNGISDEGTSQPLSAVETPKIGLDTMVESGGTNFSLGQRQIISLARAIVRRSKLLILDEATAAIDHETDAAIQRTLRSEFGSDTTFITIAHRLQTIMDYDRIMVLDAGKLVEFDTPKNLLKNEKGYLRALVDESEDKETLLKLVGNS